MHFKLLTIAALFAANASNAGTLTSDEIYRRAQAVYNNSTQLLESKDIANVNNYDSKNEEYSDRISSMQNTSNQVLSGYFKTHGIDTVNDNSNLFVLVSFSMPDNLIKQYIYEADKYGAKVVLIGLIDNDFVETKSRVGEIVGEGNKGGLIIDPNLFTTYQVDSVPAILLTADNYPCQPGQCLAEKFDIMYGAVPIKYALESFQNEGDLKDMANNKLNARQK